MINDEVIGSSFPTPRHRWFAHPRTVRTVSQRDATAARPRIVWRWSPREILHRGGTVTRDQERAYRDLQAAQDRSDWR
ncbi:hypothetical protein ET475_13395 [Microbacterium protaetiae]|uniref:Uncharacterized protein n=1 Tax=Microbacterium protaetiae TaxID=2509458 RepID=A0A4P6EEW3_9MICO|nr:hypothetical protein [Microbacterium protaetiae]QAY60882.1 hypothetical protein ET475_13395 [Microbacterium protaetiae]